MTKEWLRNDHFTRVRVHARTLKSVKPQSRHGTLKPQSRHGTRKPQSPQSCHGTRKPQSRRAASSATHAPPPAFIAAALPPPWIAEAAKPQSRKLWDAGAVSCVHRRCVARASRSVKEPQSAKASKHHEASKRQSFKKRQSVKKRQKASKLQKAAQRRSVKEPPTKGWLCLEGDGLAYGKRSATKGWLCLEGDGLAYCETIRSELRRTMADVMAIAKRLKRSIRLNEWQFSFLFGWKILSTMSPPVW